jgi:DNA-binding winged helix-turn-helix (wHTH) protein
MALRFGTCTFDLEARELKRDGQVVGLAPRAFQLLALLLERRPRALSQHELRDALWPDAHVGYTSLAQVVAEIRRAIGDDAAASHLIRTVPRFGYAFVGEVIDGTHDALPLAAGVLVADDREYVIAEGETLVGRGTECGVRLPSVRVSRIHVRIHADAGGVRVSDAGSKNGTWVNGRPLAEPTRLADGDELVLGTFKLVFHPLGSTLSTRTHVRDGGPAR